MHRKQLTHSILSQMCQQVIFVPCTWAKCQINCPPLSLNLLHWCCSIWSNLFTIVLFSSLLNVLSHIEMRQITSNGGYDIDGEQLFICRSHKYGQIIPGKYSHSIGKCSVTHNRREAQFNRYEMLIEGGDTKYEWVTLRKPVSALPQNVLFGGNQFAQSTKRPSTAGDSAPVEITNNKGELNTQSLDLILSSDRVWGTRKRRIRRSIQDHDKDDHDWSPNWRGHMFEGVERIRSFTSKAKLLKIASENRSTFTEIPGERKKCLPRHNMLVANPGDCIEDAQKANFYIAKCALRTGNITSEQIGKIWWKESIQEWIASFPFGGHEIYCLDYSVLTLKS